MPNEACLKCGAANPRDKYACTVCGARLPWADAAQLRAQNPPPRAEIKVVRPSYWLAALLCATMGVSGASFMLWGGSLPSLPKWHFPNTKPRAVQEDEIRVAVFKKMLPAPDSKHRDQLCFLSLGQSLGKDPDDFVMQQLVGYYPFVKKLSEASIDLKYEAEAVKDGATGQQGVVLFVAMDKFGQDKAQVSAGYWAGMMMSCWSGYDVEWDGSQWIVGEAQGEACS